MSKYQTTRQPIVAPILLVALGLASLLGLVAGSAFFWAAPRQAWSIFIAGFLWTLIVAVVASLVRLVRERLQRNQWRRGIVLGCVMTFPLTTVYLVVSLLVSAQINFEVLDQVGNRTLTSRPDPFFIGPIFYTFTLLIALLVGPVFVLTSPFGRGNNPSHLE